MRNHDGHVVFSASWRLYHGPSPTISITNIYKARTFHAPKFVRRDTQSELFSTPERVVSHSLFYEKSNRSRLYRKKSARFCVADTCVVRSFWNKQRTDIGERTSCTGRLLLFCFYVSSAFNRFISMALRLKFKYVVVVLPQLSMQSK